MAQPLLKQLMRTFDASPTGYPGDEDNGRRSFRGTFRQFQFDPLHPGTAEYVIDALVQMAEVKCQMAKYQPFRHHQQSPTTIYS